MMLCVSQFGLDISLLNQLLYAAFMYIALHMYMHICVYFV